MEDATNGAGAGAGAAVADGGRTIVQSARDHDVSWPVASAAVTAYAATVLPDQPQPVEVLGISTRFAGVGRSGSSARPP